MVRALAGISVIGADIGCSFRAKDRGRRSEREREMRCGISISVFFSLCYRIPIQEQLIAGNCHILEFLSTVFCSVLQLLLQLQNAPNGRKSLPNIHSVLFDLTHSMFYKLLP